MASSGKLNVDRRKWPFSRNHFFPEEIWERCSHHTNFSFRKTSQSSPSISDLSLELHNSNSNLFGWAVRGRLVPHSFFGSCSKLEFAHYTQCIFLTLCDTHMWYSHSSLMSVQLPVARALSKLLLGVSVAHFCKAFLFIAEHGEK